MGDGILTCKKCGGCGMHKPIKEFSPHKNTRDNLQPKCKLCRNSLSNIKRMESPYKPYDRDAYMDKYSADRRREDKKRNYQRNKRVVIDRALKWAKDNPAAMAARAMHRLALQRNATPVWADIRLIEGMYEEAKKREIETGVKWHVDHSVPLKSKIVCGLHVQNNLALMTASENIAKSNRHWPDMP